MLIALVLLAACTPAEKVQIGGIFHLTGPGNEWGIPEKNAALLAIEDINAEGGIGGIPAELAIEDTQTDFTATSTAITKLATIDRVPIIVGPTWFSQIASPKAQELQIPIISTSGGVVTQGNQYFFNVWPHEREEILPMVEHMQAEGIQTVAILYTQNDWSVSMKENFAREAALRGMEITGNFPSENRHEDFRTIIERIRRLNPDAIYFPAADYISQGHYSTQASQLNLEIPLYSSSGTENAQLLEVFPAIDGTIYPYPVRSPEEQAFIKRYENEYGARAGPSTSFAYDATILAAMALRSELPPEEYLAQLSEDDPFVGLTNEIWFDETGKVAHKPHLMKIVRNGEFVVIDR